MCTKVQDHLRKRGRGRERKGGRKIRKGRNGERGGKEKETRMVTKAKPLENLINP